MAFSSGAITKAGTIQGWGSATPTDGWLLCDGSAVSRTLYAELFAAIGTTYGAGNGTTTFNIPNISNIITSVNTNVPVIGNGKGLGIVGPNGETVGIGVNPATYMLQPTNKNLSGGVPQIKTGSGIGTTGNGYGPSYCYGVSSDASKSGIVGTITRTVTTLWFLVKY